MGMGSEKIDNKHVLFRECSKWESKRSSYMYEYISMCIRKCACIRARILFIYITNSGPPLTYGAHHPLAIAGGFLLEELTVEELAMQHYFSQEASQPVSSAVFRLLNFSFVCAFRDWSVS